jgi:hypothetical protein
VRHAGGLAAVALGRQQHHDRRRPHPVGGRPCNGAASVTSAASTGAPASGRCGTATPAPTSGEDAAHRSRSAFDSCAAVGPLAHREKRAHASPSSPSPRLAPPSCSTTQCVSRRSARPSTGSSEAPRLNCVACDSSSRYFCASGLIRWAASTSRRRHSSPSDLPQRCPGVSTWSRLTIRVLELRRCNDWAQLQDRVDRTLERIRLV